MKLDTESLSHAKWNCKQHIVFAPKYRRQIIYGKIKQDIGIMLRKLCSYKQVEIIEAEACKDHIPDYYITIKELKSLGWRKGKTISKFIDDKVLTKGIYKNKNGHLPQVSGRIWYEADINYTSGPRNSQRVLLSNDGLIFVTYDHYETFYEIF